MRIRYELKYIIPRELKELIFAYWMQYLMKAPYTDELGQYPILSQYYDTADFLFHSEKLAGIGIRRKVRLRTYGYGFRPHQVTFLEIKQRVQNDQSIKARKLIKSFHPKFIDPENWPYNEDYEFGRFCALRDYHSLRLSAQVFYFREAYQGTLDPDLRITFDSSLIALHPGENLTRDLLYDQSRTYLPESKVILEIKNNGPLPDWVHDMIQQVEIVQEPVPKYVMAVDFLRIIDITRGAYV